MNHNYINSQWINVTTLTCFLLHFIPANCNLSSDVAKFATNCQRLSFAYKCKVHIFMNFVLTATSPMFITSSHESLKMRGSIFTLIFREKVQHSIFPFYVALAYKYSLVQLVQHHYFYILSPNFTKSHSTLSLTNFENRATLHHRGRTTPEVIFRN